MTLISPPTRALLLGLALSWSAIFTRGAGPVPEIVVTNNYVLNSGSQVRARLIVRAGHITIEGNGSALIGPGEIGNVSSLENAGIGILIEGASGVVVRDIAVRGFATGLVLRQVQAACVSGCNFSDNYHNPAQGWGELPPRGGILCEQIRHCVFQQNRANRVWDGLHLIDSDDNLAVDNDFSHCSNTAARLWKSCRNRFLRNNLSYGIRIDRAAGEVHARDSTCVLIETGSDDNYWFGNEIRYGGDGIFIRPLNRWVSVGNVFVENDASYANNNCVESWSPGNIFIRNKANHGSYGFWLGGSDHTVLQDNEAAFNGLPTGNHNAPEPGFGHGGIVIVGGPSSHTLIEGNDLHDNNGAGLAFRGDAASQGRAWRTEHWVVQENRVANNRFGIWGRWGEAILLAGNVFTNNAQGNYITNVADLVELPSQPQAGIAPVAEILGPELAQTGERLRFDASSSRDAAGRSLSYHWWLEGKAGQGPLLERVFTEPGYYRLGLTVDNGALAALAWRDLLVAQPVAHELGTEGQAKEWGYELEGNDDGKGRVRFADDAQAIVGQQCLRFTPGPYPGAYATVIYPAARDADWDFSRGKQIRFWIKARNPNLPGFQNAGPVVRLLGSNGQIELKPAKDANALNDPPLSEARWLWMPMAIPLQGNAQWERNSSGQVALDHINALSLSLDSWGGEPFSIWLDGLSVD
jgi:nitrous oxidase accessory protein NosD